MQRRRTQQLQRSKIVEGLLGLARMKTVIALLAFSDPVAATAISR